MSGFIQRMLAEEFISKLCSKSMLITCCIILALTTGCTESLKNSTSDSSLAALGGKAHTFVDLPGYFVEFFTDYNLAGNTDSFCSGVHIGDGYVLTAAHCLDSLLTCATDLNHVFINTIVSSPSGRREQKLALAEVDGIALHAGWTPTEDYLHMGTGDDIALIKTDLAIAEQAELPGYPLDIKHSRFSGGELRTYGIGGSFEHQSHHEWSRSRASYFGGVVSADRSHTPLSSALINKNNGFVKPKPILCLLSRGARICAILNKVASQLQLPHQILLHRIRFYPTLIFLM